MKSHMATKILSVAMIIRLNKRRHLYRTKPCQHRVMISSVEHDGDTSWAFSLTQPTNRHFRAGKPPACRSSTAVNGCHKPQPIPPIIKPGCTFRFTLLRGNHHRLLLWRPRLVADWNRQICPSRAGSAKVLNSPRAKPSLVPRP